MRSWPHTNTEGSSWQFWWISNKTTVCQSWIPKQNVSRLKWDQYLTSLQRIFVDKDKVISAMFWPSWVWPGQDDYQEPAWCLQHLVSQETEAAFLGHSEILNGFWFTWCLDYFYRPPNWYDRYDQIDWSIYSKFLVR